jgi:hypothetical protein
LETSVSFADWVKNGWLVAHRSSSRRLLICLELWRAT